MNAKVHRSSRKRKNAVGSRRDRLSTLPPEVLDNVFAFVRLASPDQGVGPVSKHLLPYTRSTVFQTLHVSSPAVFGRLCQMVRANGHLAPYVRDLSLHLGEDEPIPQDLRLQTLVGAPPDEDYFDLFASLTSLTTIFLDSPNCTSLLLSDRFAQSLPFLKSLRLLIRTVRTFDELSQLQQHPSLVSLKLLFCRTLWLPSCSYGSRITPSVNFDVSDAPFRAIKYLCLVGDDCASSSHVIALVLSLGDLRGLTVIDGGGEEDVDLNPILLAANPGLLQLSITHDEGFVGEPYSTIDQTLLKFTKLEALKIDHISTGPAFYDVLRHLPLHTLTFGPFSRPNAQELIALVRGTRGTRGNSSIHLIHLSNVDGVIGDDLSGHSESEETDGSEDSVWSQDTLQAVLRGWVFPEWTDDFTEEDARWLLIVAKAAGVRVEGTVHDALATMSVREEQLRSAYDRASD